MANGPKKHIDRRDFLRRGALAALAASIGGACSRERPTEATKPRTPKKRPAAARPVVESWQPFPVVDAAGTPFEIGAAIGSMTQGRIRAGIARRQAWFEDLKAFALADRDARIDPFVAALGARFPDVLAEIDGMAQGAGLSLDDLLVLNLQCELGALKAEAASCDACSTFHLVHGGRALLMHNEDGDDAYRDLMAILRLKPEGRPAVTALAYPGVVPGCVPAINDAGLVQTTNFIGAAGARPGVPRYAVGRATLAARTFDEALAVARAPDAAFSFHLNLGSIREKRLVAVDVAPGGVFDTRETEGLFLQTNHFVLPDTRDLPQPDHRLGGSSDSRYRVLEQGMAGLPPVANVTADHLLGLLASHEAIEQPFSPCRHPRGDVHGRTLGTAVFDIAAGSFTLYEGNPCESRRRQIEPA
ncbi:MAG TPA: C45 family peptidase [Polyangia bacterium]|nr:C45 family peptidase [Polyangia bacterium]